MRLSMRVLILATLAVVLLGGAVRAEETFKTVLPENGLTVILRENHSSPVVNLRFYVKSGSIHEGQYLGAGITHYLEHLMSDGTTNRTLEEIEREVEEIGGGYNAYTTKDHACYFIETSKEHFDQALDLLSDQAMNVTLPQEAVDTQEGIIIREINMGYDEPSRRIYNMFGEVMFRVHPTKYPVIGYVENFERLTREDVVDYHSRMYVPNNIIFVAVGDFDQDEALEKIREAFKDFERRPLDLPTLPSEPPQLGRRVLREQRDLDMAYVLMGFHTVQLSHPDLYPLDVFSHILSEGKSSRLYRKLVDELGLVYSVTTWSHTPAYDAGTFAISMTMDPANIDAAIEAVTEEIYKFKKKKVTKAEIGKAKKIKTAEFFFGMQDVESIASSLGRSELTSGNPDFDEAYAANIQGVTANEIIDVVNRYFYDDNIGIAILEPHSDEEQAAVKKTRTAPDVGEIEKHVLDNGLTILIKENRTTPIVSIGSYSFGGARFEEADRNGVANYVTKMMPRGTRKRSGEKIARELDTMGASYSCSANHTRIECEMTVLAEDLPKGLDLFADVLRSPKFDAKEMEKERELVQASILARADNWTTDAMDRMLIELYPTHPYGRPPVGTAETVDAISRDDLAAHHAEYVTPNNTVITVFGDVDSGEVLATLKKSLGKWKSGAEASPGAVREADRGEPEIFTTYHDRAQTIIFMGYRGMPYESEDRYAMDVLDAVISGIYYPGGWLHTDLRGNSLVYVVHAYNWTGYDAGYFGIYAATYDEALDQAVDIINGYMGQIVDEQVSDEELGLAKQLCVIMKQTSEQTNQSQAKDAAIAELYGLGYDYNENYGARIKAVTRADVQAVAAKYLKNPVTILRRPEPEEHAQTE